MRVVVAGGGGFIGSHLVDLLVEREDEVLVLDDFSTGRRANLTHLADDPLVSVVEHDVRRPLPTLGSIDAVVNLASPASPADFATMPLEILEVGSEGTRRLLDLAYGADARFVLASSSEVYGEPLGHPQDEEQLGLVDPVGPRSCYDEAKRYAEALSVAHARVHGTNVGIARIFNTYGERMDPDDGRVVNTFLRQAIRGEPMTVFGDGSHTRSFCHVSDLVLGLGCLLDGDHRGPLNLGNPIEVSMLELAGLVAEACGSSSHVVFEELPVGRAGDPTRRRPDVTLAGELLGWRPSVGLPEGLARMVDHYRSTEHLG